MKVLPRAYSRGSSRTSRTMARFGSERGVVLHALLFIVVSVLAGVLVAGLVIPFAGMIGLSARSATDSFENMNAKLDRPPLPQRSRMFAADGSLLATFYDENRVEVRLDQVAPVMRDAIISTEDAGFYEHGPLDVKGAMRAFLRNSQSSSGVSQGGSTITQQYVKQVLFENADTPAEKKAALEDSYGRKLQELRYAVELEKTTPKDEILADYLNIVYFGDGAYGIESAAKHYFSVPANKLTLTQAAMLAGMVRDPIHLDPTKHPEDVLQRRNFVLSRMVAAKKIDQATADKAGKQGLGLKLSGLKAGCYPSPYPQFCDFAQQWLINHSGDALGKTKTERQRMLLEGGLTIMTSIDPQAQRAAQQSVSKYVYPTDPAVGVVSIIEPGTGLIKAMAQSKGYGEGPGKSFINYNVTQQDNGPLYGFQPGSTMKPFVLTAALEQGFSLSRKLPAPSRMPYPPMTTCGGKKYKYEKNFFVSNSTKAGAPMINAITGTVRSVNTFFVNLEAVTGICAPMNIATNAGVRRGDGGKLAAVPSFVLGTNEVTPLSMADAYATFAARGKHCDPLPVTKVLDRNGNPIQVAGANCKQVIPQKIADGVTYVLNQNVDGGTDPYRTAKKMAIQGRQVGGKTGTNNERIAVSFAGITPNMAAFAVVSDSHKRLQPLLGQHIGGRYMGNDEVWGGALAGPIWKGAMEGALQGLPSVPFTPPDPKLIKGVQAKVPNVVGQWPDAAKKTLEAAHFTGSIAGQISSNLPKGQVAKQNPGPYSQAGMGDTVLLYLSNGQPATPPPGPPNPGPTFKCPPFCMTIKPPKHPGPGGGGGGGGPNAQGTDNGSTSGAPTGGVW